MAVIAITSSGRDPVSPLEVRFGRAPYIILYREDTCEYQCFPNPGLEAPGGAGIKAAQFIVDQGVEVLITGRVGPNAGGVLEEAGIKVYTSEERGSVEELLREYQGK